MARSREKEGERDGDDIVGRLVRRDSDTESNTIASVASSSSCIYKVSPKSQCNQEKVNLLRTMNKEDDTKSV